MKILYLDCGMGAAGDMLTAALLELLPEREAFLDKLNSVGIPGVRYNAKPSVKCGITGTHVAVTVFGEEEESADYGHGHKHDNHATSTIMSITAMPTRMTTDTVILMAMLTAACMISSIW
ncbi:MAG: nickel insertion protein [Anaerovoracaceae bacterium]